VLFKKNTAELVESLELTVISVGQFIGEEDIVNNQFYHTSVQCISMTGNLFKISRDDFKKIEKHKEQWEAIQKEAEIKIKKYSQKMFSMDSVKQKI
jgi:hypothetical protein